MTLTAVEVLAPDGRPLLRLEGDALVATTQPLFGAGLTPPAGTVPTAQIPPSGTVAVVVDVAVPADRVPARLTHRIAYDLPPDAPPAALTASRRVDGPELAVDPRQPVVLAPPLRGPGWLTANSCCDAFTTHRSGRGPVDGARLVKPETFAIDWVRLRDGRLFEGDGMRNEQWFGHRAEVVAAAAGTVVFARDGLPEGTPYAPPTGVEGNGVIVQIGPGAWAFYAHLQPGSVAVAVGDQVAAGQLLGRLGNSGGSLAPHLHFGLLDGPDPLTANSLPFVLDRYTLVGAVEPSTYVAVLTGSGAPALRAEGPPGPQASTLPLNLTVTDFR